jgi:hypothetical protein
MDRQWDVTSNNEAQLIDQGHHTTTNWSFWMQEREEGDDMRWDKTGNGSQGHAMGQVRSR